MLHSTNIVEMKNDTSSVVQCCEHSGKKHCLVSYQREAGCIYMYCVQCVKKKQYLITKEYFFCVYERSMICVLPAVADGPEGGATLTLTLTLP